MQLKGVVLRSRPPFTGVLRAPGRKVPPGVLFERFWAPGSECPKECFLSAFWHFWGSKSAKKHSKSTLWGTRSQVPKNTQKALRGTFRPGPPEHSCKWRPGSHGLCAIRRGRFLLQFPRFLLRCHRFPLPAFGSPDGRPFKLSKCRSKAQSCEPFSPLQPSKTPETPNLSKICPTDSFPGSSQGD